jgi:excisionase family DNA binding protein
MEIVNIDAKTFQEMLNALYDLEKEVKLLRNLHSNNQLNEWLDNQEVCEMLNISLRTLQYLKNRGNITFTQMGRKTYYHKQEVMNLIKKQKYGKNTDQK